MALTAVAMMVLVVQYFVFTMLVGKARGQSGVKAPATTGDPLLERTIRVQANTLEQLAIVLMLGALDGAVLQGLRRAGVPDLTIE